MRPFGLLSLSLSFAIVVACGSSGSDDTPGAGGPGGGGDADSDAGGGDGASADAPQGRSLSIQAAATVLALRRGGTANVALTVTRAGFDGPVVVSVSGLSAGVTAKPLTIAAGATTATLSLDATKDATLGKASASIDASSGDLSAKEPITLVVGDGGGLDPTFGTGGIATLTGADIGRWPSSMAIQPDAKILVGVQHSDAAPPPPVDIGGVYRFTDAGALDTTFGTAGLVTLPAITSAFRLALQPDGKILACGSAKTSQLTTIFRLLPTGAIDTTFGTSGMVQSSPGGPQGCMGMALDATGRIVVTAYETTTDTPAKSIAVVMRRLATGALNPTFGTGGMTTTQLGGQSASLDTIRVTPSGLFAIGTRQMGGTTYVRGVVAKLDANGALDPTFATAGVYEHTYSVFEVLPLATGSLLFGNQIQYYRLTPAGALDTMVGKDGGLESSTDDWLFPFSVSTVDAAGELYRFRYDDGNWLPELWAYKPDGSIDTTFATGGRLKLTPGMPTPGVDVQIGPDGRLVVLAGEGTAIWLARFLL